MSHCMPTHHAVAISSHFWGLEWSLGAWSVTSVTSQIPAMVSYIIWPSRYLERTHHVAVSYCAFALQHI